MSWVWTTLKRVGETLVFLLVGALVYAVLLEVVGAPVIRWAFRDQQVLAERVTTLEVQQAATRNVLKQVAAREALWEWRQAERAKARWWPWRR